MPVSEIDNLMNKLVGQIPLPGIGLGIRYKDAVYEQGFGLSDVSSGELVTPQTVFRIGSITKSFTAAAILRLTEEGKLSLDDSISRHLPGVPEAAQNVLIRHLLNHTSGLPDASVDEALAALPENFTTTEAVEYYFGAFERLEFEPGEMYSYNNSGYALLGAILENATGMRYDEYFRMSFFEPLGLHSTGECGPQFDSLAVGYHPLNRGFEPASPSDVRLGATAGSLCSTAKDLLKWQEALTDAAILEPETWQLMITPQELSGGGHMEYGYGLVIRDGDQGRMIFHDGATAGFTSYFVYYPDHELSIVLLTNSDGFDPPLESVASLLAARILRSS